MALAVCLKALGTYAVSTVHHQMCIPNLAACQTAQSRQ